MQQIPTLVTFIRMLHLQKIRMEASIGPRNQQDLHHKLDLILQGDIFTAFLIQQVLPSQELTESVRSFSDFSLLATRFLTKLYPGGDKLSAILSGTMAPGLFCFVVSGFTVFPLGPPSITSPVNSALFSSNSIRSVSLEVRGLLNSRSYAIAVNQESILIEGLEFVTSTPQGTISLVLDLSGQPDGAILIEILRGYDAAAIIGVQIIKDTVAPIGIITSPIADARIDTATMSVFGTADLGTSVSLTISDMVDETSDIAITSIRVDAAGNWAAENINIADQADGAITITATFSDAVGNSAINRVRVTKFTPGLFSITSPSSGSYINSVTASSVGVAGRGDAGLVTVTATDSRNTITATTTAADQTWALLTNLNFESFAEGTVTLVATLTDADAGTQLATATSQVIKDTVAAIAITTPISDSYINSMTAPAFAIAGTGDARGLVIVTFTDIRGSSLTSRTTVLADQSWSATANLAALVEGTVTVLASITDPAGNQAFSTTLELTKDTRASVAITSPINGASVNLMNAAAFPISGTGKQAGKHLLLSLVQAIAKSRQLQ